MKYLGYWFWKMRDLNVRFRKCYQAYDLFVVLLCHSFGFASEYAFYPEDDLPFLHDTKPLKAGLKLLLHSFKTIVRFVSSKFHTQLNFIMQKMPRMVLCYFTHHVPQIIQNNWVFVRPSSSGWFSNDVLGVICNVFFSLFISRLFVLRK